MEEDSEPQEKGRMGGAATREKYGPEHYRRIGKLGGSATAERHGPSHYSRIGRLHGKKMVEESE